MGGMGVWSLGREDPLEKEMPTYSNILAWEILRTEKPGGLQLMGSQRVWHDLVTKQEQQSTYYMPETSPTIYKHFFFLTFNRFNYRYLHIDLLPLNW